MEPNTDIAFLLSVIMPSVDWSAACCVFTSMLIGQPLVAFACIELFQRSMTGGFAILWVPGSRGWVSPGTAWLIV